MIPQPDDPVFSIRYCTMDNAERIIADLENLITGFYFFDEVKEYKRKLLDIVKQGSSDRYQVFFVSDHLEHITVMDFIRWNELAYDPSHYFR